MFSEHLPCVRNCVSFKDSGWLTLITRLEKLTTEVLPNTSSLVCSTGRPKKPKRQRLGQRKVIARAVQEEWAALAQKT